MSLQFILNFHLDLHGMRHCSRLAFIRAQADQDAAPNLARLPNLRKEQYTRRGGSGMYDLCLGKYGVSARIDEPSG